MVYRGSEFVEKIVFSPAGEPENMHCIEMRKGDGVFTVGRCCDPEWNYAFHMDMQSDYERVKFNIMEQIFECESLEELLDNLTDIFEDGFTDILIEDSNDDE